MRMGWMAVALLALNQSAGAADVTVFLTGDTAGFNYLTKSAADLLFHQAGISVDWRGPKIPAGGVPSTWLRLELMDRTPMGETTEALGVSYPYAGCDKGITIYLDRIRERARGVLRESAMLAYVLVHEITHVIQGVYHHSTAGVMKAEWDENDRAAIFEKRLAF